MKRELTRRYSVLFEKKGVKKSLQFAQDLYRYGKLRELSSFAVWELFHRVGIFPKRDYLKFSRSEVIQLEKERLGSPEFDEKVTHYFAAQGLTAVRCNHNWKLLYFHGDQEMFGCLYPNDCDLYKSVDRGKSLVFLQSFPEDIKSIFISSHNTIFVCVKGSLYRSSDHGASFQKVLDLGSPVSYFRFNNAMTETPDKTLVAAEYGNIYDGNGWRKLAYLYYSSDDGKTWKRSDFLIQQKTNKHVHIVKYSPLLNKLMMADGDNYKRLWLSDSLDVSDAANPHWNNFTKFHIQMGGYTSVVETNGTIYFGTDYQGGTNFIVETSDGKKFTKKIVPDPYRRSPIDHMVLRKSTRGEEIWGNLPFSTAGTKCLLMYTADGGVSWNRVFEYNRSAHTVWLVSASKETAANELYFSVADSRNNTRVVYKIVDN